MKDKYSLSLFLENTKPAFTLAEVLITLVIIGVIAAITIPAIISNYTEQEKYSRVKKTYSTLANAMTRVKADGGDMIFDVVDQNTANIKQWYNEYLSNYLITTKVCYDSAGCWNLGDTKNYKGENATWNRRGVGVGINIVTAILNDGTYIDIDACGRGDIFNYFGVSINTQSSLALYFDINGSKPPNTIGKDIFVTVFTENGLVPAYKDKTAAQTDAECSKSGRGYSCIQKYLKYNNR